MLWKAISSLKDAYIWFWLYSVHSQLLLKALVRGFNETEGKGKEALAHSSIKHLLKEAKAIIQRLTGFADPSKWWQDAAASIRISTHIYACTNSFVCTYTTKLTKYKQNAWWHGTKCQIKALQPTLNIICQSFMNISFIMCATAWCTSHFKRHVCAYRFLKWLHLNV